MSGKHILEGILLLAVMLMLFGVKYFRIRKRAPLGTWGWAGLAIILLADLLLFRRVNWVTTFFTPLVWTGYLLLIDALVWSLRGESRLGRAPRQFFSLVFWSVPLWLVFEAYNLQLKNWSYIGLPNNLVLRGIGYAWSFATIWPAVFETADFVQALGFFREQGKLRIECNGHTRFSIVGLVLVTVPLLLPVRAGRYLFGAVWVGFILLLDPLNYRWKGRSLLRDFETGQTATFSSFLVSGFVCGILWEFWNSWASARWLYVFPIWQQLKVFEMPLPGYLGFPPFALECFVMYEFLRTVKNQLLGSRGSPEWDMVRSN